MYMRYRTADGLKESRAFLPNAKVLLFSLLLQISHAIKEEGNDTARGKLAKLISDALAADGCGIYLRETEKADFLLSRQYSYQTDFCYADAWWKYKHIHNNHVEYIDDPDQTREFPFKNCLILPLLLENEQRIMGFVLTGWQDALPIGALAGEDYQVLQIISQLLSNIYCVYPLIDRLRTRDADVAVLYRTAERELQDSRKGKLGLLTAVEAYIKEYLEVTAPEPEPIKKDTTDIPPDILSARESQVLRLLSHGYSCREIGERLFFATSTVETYKQRIKKKLNLSDKKALIEYAIRHKIYEEL